MAIIMKCRNRFCKEKVRIRKDSEELRDGVRRSNSLFGQSETPFSYSAHLASTRLGNAPHLQVEITLFHQFLGVKTNTYLTENDKRMFAWGPFGEDSIIVQCSIKFAFKVPAPDSDDEPQRLVNSRQAYKERRRVYEPNASDTAGLSKIGHFELVSSRFTLGSTYFDNAAPVNWWIRIKVVIVAIGGPLLGMKI
jgi:hypothetical protein